MLQAALDTNYIRQEDLASLQQWRKDPSVWNKNK